MKVYLQIPNLQVCGIKNIFLFSIRKLPGNRNCMHHSKFKTNKNPPKGFLRKKIMKSLKSIALMLAATFTFNAVSAQNTMGEKTVEVGGAPMYPSKNIVENAVNSKDHTTLVAAVKAAGLVETLQGAGPFTVFAPTNKAFEMLPKGTVETLLMAENKAKLTGILTYHVVAGRMGTKELDDAITKGNGTAELATVAGGKLWVSKKGKKYMLKDENGGTAKITISNVYQSNGVIHVIDHVVLPK
jgi:uncharacterized surface protein with fasciclin (FAS1) repeats